jgi:hypothetical protein
MRLPHRQLSQIFFAGSGGSKQDSIVTNSARERAKVDRLTGARKYDINRLFFRAWQPIGEPLHRDRVVVREHHDHSSARSLAWYILVKDIVETYIGPGHDLPVTF